jgi:RNA polymerase sigma-70 factor (ECF subfamily)
VEGVSQEARAEDVPRLTEHLFRHEAGKLVSMLTGIFGIERLQLAEDVVQEALIRAMKTWPFYGVPKNPPAWLMQTAKHLALDAIRREKWFQDRLPQITATLERWPDQDGAVSPRFAEELSDGRLRLMFLCCHPDIPPESQIALALKTLCGFSPAEIARAFFTSEAAIAKRLTRARQRIQDLRLRFEIPAGPELSERLDGVLHILYLLFNEGYKASAGDRLIREELCHEALRLGELLAGHPSTGRPRTHALVALMWLNAARLAGRTGPEGGLLRLEHQDRSRWNREMIARGVSHLGISAQGAELSEYHLQAGIAACHGLAPDYESTDWLRILEYYDRWIERNPSPVVALNRAVALARVKGPEAGIAAVQAIPGREQLDSYHLVYAVLGEFEAEQGNFQAAAAHFRRALQLAELKSEQNHLEGRLDQVGRI